MGYQALRASTGDYTTGIGAFSLNLNTTGEANTAVGRACLADNTTGSYNTSIGYNTNTGNFSGSLILGHTATATASNQCVFGSATVNAGSVTAEVNVSANVWNVRINGVARKILLA
jgi:hypothetical protein